MLSPSLLPAEPGLLQGGGGGPSGNTSTWKTLPRPGRGIPGACPFEDLEVVSSPFLLVSLQFLSLSKAICINRGLSLPQPYSGGRRPLHGYLDVFQLQGMGRWLHWELPAAGAADLSSLLLPSPFTPRSAPGGLLDSASPSLIPSLLGLWAKPLPQD